jgi:hypothetical protein
MKKKLIILIIAPFLMFSCFYGSFESPTKVKLKKVKLKKEIKSDELFTYENKSAIVYMDKKNLIRFLNYKIHFGTLCKQKKMKCKVLLDKLKGTDLNGYAIDQKKLSANKFTPQFTDTTNTVFYANFPSWIISDMILKGKAKIFSKQKQKNQDFMYHKIVRSGYGNSEAILFSYKSTFLTLKYMSDVVSPDFDCMDSTELKRYNHQ